MLFCCSSEDGGEREGERREDVEAESGPAGAADPGVPGPDGGPDPAAGAVGARQGQVHTHTQSWQLATNQKHGHVYLQQNRSELLC